jgi:F-type H+-transporting ATPase subunit delta
MPLNPVIAKRYANSLYQLTIDKTATSFYSKAPQILAELNAFLTAIKSFPEGILFFLNPTVSHDEKLSTIKELENKLPTIFQFIKTLIEADRMEYFEEIVQNFQRICEEASGELTVDVEFAHAPSPAILEDVRATLHAEWKRQIKIRSAINSHLIGGFVAKAPGRIMDVSVSSQLEALQQQLTA